MADGCQSHDFDWVTALQECSVPMEFVRLAKQVRENVETRQKAVEGRVMEVIYESNRTSFSVACSLGVGVPRKIAFTLEDDCIVAHDELSGKGKHRLTLTLNDEGECRYRLDGDPKQLLRWQVARRILEPLLFPSGRSGRGE